MELKRAETIAKDLIQYYCGSVIRFKFDKAMRRFGCYSHRKQQITISERLAMLNREERVLNTILHEIAHALSPIQENHGQQWKEKALSIGCDGERLYSNDVIRATPKYMMYCEECDHFLSGLRHRKSNNLFHKHCGTKIKFIGGK